MRSTAEISRANSANAIKAGIAIRERAIRDYQLALESGDPISYVMGGINTKSTKVYERRRQAVVKLRRWEKQYSSYVNKPHSGPETAPEIKHIAERAISDYRNEAYSNVSNIFSAKLNDLGKQADDIKQQIDVLMSKRDDIMRRISNIRETAAYLEVAI